jgi:hypothetical protein
MTEIVFWLYQAGGVFILMERESKTEYIRVFLYFFIGNFFFETSMNKYFYTL